ncbi:PIR protein [Plasmodium ovale]|uniref:PIR protein n=1 Tax=Plasmodium ovale TaxID=36330 RepID=A0A1D3JD88_PLAOA|nr:PIR protein [Plasmodium ovale]
MPTVFSDNYPSLMNLPIKRIYRKFNEYYSYEKYVNTPCNSFLEEFFPHKDDVISVCLKIDQILKKSNTDIIYYKTFTINKYCKYLSYFLYDKIMNSNKYNNIHVLYDTLNKIKKIYGLNDNCNIINFSIDKEQFDKKKALYLHGEILNWIKDNSATYDSSDSQIFSKYFSECVNTYSRIAQNNYCKEFKNYEEELDHFLRNFKEAKNILEEKKIIISGENIKILEKPTCTSEDGSVPPAHETDVVPHTDDGIPSIAISSDVQTDQMESTDAGTDITSGLVFSSLAGMILFSFIFYKFTPFGTWLHRKIGSINKNFNLDVKNNEFIEDTFDNENINIYDDTYHMKYHSSENA